VVANGSDSARDVAGLFTAMNTSGFARVVYDESHDLVGDLNGTGAQRLPYRIQSTAPTGYYARKRSMLAAAVVLTTPGIPMLFMGQEMLETQQFGDSNPLHWAYQTTYASVVQFYHDLIRLRRNLDGVSLGLTGPNITSHVVDNTAKVLAFHRWGAGPNDQVMVAMNFSNKALTNYAIGGFPANGTWYVNLNSDWTTYGSDFENKGSGLVQVTGGTGQLTLGRYSVQILSRQALPQPQFTGIQAGSGHVTLRWTGGQSAPQILQQASQLSGPWIAVYTNSPPITATNSLTLALPGISTSFFRIQAAP
jgi:1,4-alpha-glucan branching enzyme